MTVTGIHQGFPAIAKVAANHLLICHGDTNSDGGFQYGIDFRGSTDGGDTWSVLTDPVTRNQKVQLWNGSTWSLSANNWTTALGDPIQSVTGMFVTAAGTWLICGTIKSGTPTTPRPSFLRSTDQGAHWLVSAAAPTPWSAGYPGNHDILATPLNEAGDGSPVGRNNGPIVQLASGRIVAIMYGNVAATDTFTSSATIYSDDDGITWNSGVVVANGQTLGYAIQEPCICLLDDGSLYVMNRHTSQRSYQRSTDGGATWSAPTFIDGYNFGRANVYQGTVSSVGNAWGDMIAFHRPFDYWRLLTFTISTDRGATWSALGVVGRCDTDLKDVPLSSFSGPITGGRSAYADVIELSPGVLAVAYGMEFTERVERDYSSPYCATYFVKLEVA